MTVNVVKAIDQHADAALADARAEADLALAQFVDAQRRVSELEALVMLRRAMGATVTAPDIVSITRTAGASA